MAETIKSDAPLLIEFTNDIFPRRLWVAVNPTREWVRQRFADTDGEEIEYCNDAKAAVYGNVMDNDGKYGILILIFESTLTVSEIAHEATHYAMELHRAVGEDLSIDKQEMFAYLVGYGAKCISKALEEYKTTDIESLL